jgi:hypothetical protein
LALQEEVDCVTGLHLLKIDGIVNNQLQTKVGEKS